MRCPCLLFLLFYSCCVQGVEVHGHRGMRGGVENTLPAFESALEAGVDVIELDLSLTKDHVVVIHHDPKINPRISTYRGRKLERGELICHLTATEIGEIEVQGAHIPTLEELFVFLHTSFHPRASEVKLNLEIKRNPLHPEQYHEATAYAQHVVALVEKYGFSERVYYTSFDPAILQEVKRCARGAHMGFIYNQESLAVAGSLEAILDRARSLDVEILIPEHTLLKGKEDLHALHKGGFKVFVWTVNRPERWDQLLEMGVEGIITDDPQGLLQRIKYQSVLPSYP